MRGSVGSCPHHGSWPVVFPSWCVWPLWYRMCVQSSQCVPIVTRPNRWNWKEVWSQITLTQDWSGIQNMTHIRSLRSSNLTEHNKSALTDHARNSINVINWSQATVTGREPERFTRWIKETIHIRKEGQQAMNRDEGSHTYTTAFLTRRLLVVSRTERTENKQTNKSNLIVSIACIARLHSSDD